MSRFRRSVTEVTGNPPSSAGTPQPLCGTSSASCAGVAVSRPRAGALVLAILLILTSLGGVQAQDAGSVPVDEDDPADDPYEIRFGEDREAEADYVAVSLRGDADALVAVSGDGTADGLVAVSGEGDAAGGLLGVSGTGPAGGLVAVSGTGPAFGVVPVSVLGTCNGNPCYEVTFTSGADGYYVSFSEGQEAFSQYVAASGRAPATCETQTCVAASGENDARGGLVGVSGTGPAEGQVLAVSATGDAHGGVLAASGTGDVSGFAGVTGTGNAGWFLGVSGCDTAKETDVGTVSNRACVDSPVELLP